MLPYERRTTQEQRESIRQEAYELIDVIIDEWPAIQDQAKKYRKGFSTNTIGDGTNSGGGGSSRTEALAINRSDDPGDQAAEWITDLTKAMTQLRTLRARINNVLPNPKAADKMRGRVNTVDICAECGLPAPEVKRIDGEPYHKNTCYFRRWRAIKAQAQAS